MSRTVAVRENGIIMENAKLECSHPICMLAHELINSLSVIIGHCDLLGDQDQSQDERSRHLIQIRNTAKSMAQKLNHQQCHLALMARTVPPQEKQLSPDSA